MVISTWRKTASYFLVGVFLLVGIVFAAGSRRPVALITALTLGVLFIPAEALERRGKVTWLASAVVAAISATFLVLVFHSGAVRGSEKLAWEVLFATITAIYASLAVQIALTSRRGKRDGSRSNAGSI